MFDRYVEFLRYLQIKCEISKNLSHFELEFKKFWSDTDFLEKTFVFEHCVFWNVMKDSLIQVYKNRLEEFIKLIVLSDEILKNSNFRCIVSLYTPVKPIEFIKSGI